MQFIKSFSQFLLEARMSKHGVERIEERLMQLQDITLNAAQAKAIAVDLGLSNKDIKEQLYSLLIPAILTRLDEIEKTPFEEGSRLVPIVAFKLNIGTTSEFIRLTVKSNVYKENKRTRQIEKVGEQIHKGEKIYAAINDDVLSTVLVYDADFTEKEIQQKSESHFEKKGTSRRVIAVPLTESRIVELTIVDGKVVEDTEPTFKGKNIDVEQQWAIAPGRKIGVYIPFAKGFVDGIIEDVINPVLSKDRKTLNWEKNERTFSFIFRGTINGKEYRIPKKIWIGDSVYLPVGDNNELVACEIVSPGYLFDPRAKNPINIKYKVRG